jgi:dienelactone hydrolase
MRCYSRRLTASSDPIYYGAGERPWFAYRHAARGVATGGALVIVPAFGYEAVCAHRAMRHLADSAAAAGLVALRIDLDGTGDSAGDDRDADRVGAWKASIAAAIDLVRGDGASYVVLAGLRLGATLAAAVAAERDDVAGVVALAPVVQGKKWLREMRALQQAMGLPPPPAGTAVEDGDEALGFAITAETRDAIGALDLLAATRAAPSLLVIDRDDMPASDKWLAKLRELGATVEHQRLPGYVEMVLDAHRAEVPDQMIAAAVAYARACTPRDAMRPAARVQVAQRAALGEVVEEPVMIDDRLAAIVTRPRGAQPKRALVLLNAGCVRRVGPNRMHVAIARRCAADGTLVVRADLSGIGDSGARAGQPERIVYSEHHEPEVDAIVAWCRAEGAGHVVLGGLCSGGYYAQQRAIAGAQLAAILPINPGQPGTGVDAAPFQAVEDAERYKQSVRDLGKWKKLLAGDVDMRRLYRAVRNRTRDAIELRVKELARRVGRPLRSDAGADLLRAVERGVVATYVFCSGEPGLPVFRERVGTLAGKLERAGLVVRIVDGPDHTFTPRWSQAILVDEVATALRRIG